MRALLRKTALKSKLAFLPQMTDLRSALLRTEKSDLLRSAA